MTALFLCPNIGICAAGGQQVVDMYLPINATQAYSSTFSVKTDGINWAAAQVLLTSVTTPNQTFTDGSASTMTITVTSFAAASTAAATGSLTVSTTTGLTGACISGGGPNAGSFNVCNPGNWAIGNTSSNTACNIAAAIQATNVILSTCGANNGSVVYDSAPVGGTGYNSFQIAVSTAGALLVPNLISSSPVTNIGIGTLLGGQNNASFSINGALFVANTNFFPVTSNAQTATNIATAITNSSNTIGVVASAGAGGVVFATSTAVGTNTNYATASSSQGVLTIAPFTSSSVVNSNAIGAMSNGTNAAYVVGTSTISLPGNTLGPGEGVWYSTGSGTGITNLVFGTTYYVIANVALGSGNIELATTQAGALAIPPTGQVVLASSVAHTTADQFTLNVPAISGTPLTQWVVSTDNTNWIPYTTTPFGQAVNALASYGTYFATGTLNSVDFGHMDYGWLGLSVTAPTAGAVNIKAKITGDQ